MRLVDALEVGSHGWPWVRPSLPWNAYAVTLPSRWQGEITVNAISPGWIEDSVLNALPEVAQNLIRTWHQRGWTPMGTPADIENAVALLCSEEADWITGQVIAVDGGAGLMDAALPLEIQQAVPN
jgi:NAD(P)-dependent dehydrogenase (short-subunit alcohol dehydrogenase family)